MPRKNPLHLLFIFTFLLLAFRLSAQTETTEVDSVALSIKLSEAILENDTLTFDSLLTTDINVNQIDYDGVTPLMYAADNGSIYFLNQLLIKGANVNHQSTNNFTALLGAANSKQKRAVEILLKNGAQAAAKDKWGNTSLHFAAQNNTPEIAELLISFDANINAKNKDQNTALHFAAANANDSLVVLLLNSGSKINEKDELGFTALMDAVAGNHTETAELLLSYRATLNEVNKENLSALSLAVLNGNAYLCELFLLNGADKNHRTKLARDHWYFAQGTGSEVKKVLREFKVKRNKKLVWESPFLGAQTSWRDNHLQTGILLGVKESKYNFHFQTAFGMSPFTFSTLDEIEGKTYQFWKHEYLLSFEIDKYFSLKKSRKTEFGMFAGIEPCYKFGSYRATKHKPDKKPDLSPTGGLFLRIDFTEIKLGYKHSITNENQDGEFGLQVHVYIPH